MMPVQLTFGTSGLRGLVHDMTDLEVYINARGYLEWLHERGELRGGDTIAIARDLREVDPTTGQSSSPRITRAIVYAITRSTVTCPAFNVLQCGQIPTPALASYAMSQGIASIMVTGSHIPADRNGVKFYTRRGEVLKADEVGILAAVRRVRSRADAHDTDATAFDPHGMLTDPPSLAPPDNVAAVAYRQRYLDLFPGARPLEGMRLVFYQHSAVGRDLLVDILTGLGATVFPVERSEVFVPVDTEEVRPADLVRFQDLAEAYHPDAILSTDGDSDRPLVVDAHGTFHRGDALGIVVSEFLGARFAAVPVSTTDALDRFVAQGRLPLQVEHTRIGSPYVIDAMNGAIARGQDRVVGWEANGGFLTATDTVINGQTLRALPTRDALLPMLAVLLSARARGLTVAELFARLPPRATQAGLLDDFPAATSKALLASFAAPAQGVREASFVDTDAEEVLVSFGVGDTVRADPALARTCLAQRSALEAWFSAVRGFSAVARIVYVDGVRVMFRDGDIAHLRASGNAPQMRVYAVSDTQTRADAITEVVVKEPDGILRQMERAVLGHARQLP